MVASGVTTWARSTLKKMTSLPLRATPCASGSRPPLPRFKDDATVAADCNLTRS
jgi:hypothetical protein